MPQDTEYGVFEIGMNHPGEITPLVAMVRPHVAIVTTIAAAHLGSFASLDAIAMAKAEIFSGIEPGGSALIHRDVEQHGLLAHEAKRAGVGHIVSFGENPGSDLRLEDYVPLGSGGKISVALSDRSIEARIGVPGRHIAQNAVAVLGAAQLIGADVDKVAAALASYRSEKGRGARHRLQVDGGSILLIDESYNANPASMRAALELLASAAPGDRGRRIAVLGDMLELGAQSEALHAELRQPVIGSQAQVVHLAGPEMVALKEALPENLAVTHHPGAADLAASLLAGVRAGDVVMVKSSNGIGFGTVVAALLDKFPALTDSEPTDPVDPMEAKDDNPC
jgi:UDP-N-acetylmuramoyl-tripeptide--D-alanyl-D-alanine ligase